MRPRAAKKVRPMKRCNEVENIPHTKPLVSRVGFLQWDERNENGLSTEIQAKSAYSHGVGRGCQES